MKRIAIAVGAVSMLVGAGLVLVFYFADYTLEVEPQPGAGGVALPTGRVVTFYDSVWGQPGTAGLTIRFRFLEPDLQNVIAATDYEDIEADMQHLCETYALDRIANTGPQPSQVVVSISNVPVEFGAPDPNVVQIFEAYRPEGDRCVWESF